MMCSEYSNFKVPLTRIVYDDLEEALKRIREVIFLPKRIEIKLISDNPSVRGSIIMLSMVVLGKANNKPYVSSRIDLLEECKNDFIIYDFNKQSLIIPIPGAEKIIFIGTDRKEIKEYSKE